MIIDKQMKIMNGMSIVGDNAVIEVYGMHYISAMDKKYT